MAQWIKDPAHLCGIPVRFPGPEQWIKDPVWPQLWHKSQMRLRFNPWPGNFHMPQVWPKEEKKKKAIKDHEMGR